MDSNETERLMTVEEVAEYLTVKKGTVYNWVNRKEIPFRKVGTALRFSRSEVDAWTEQHRQDEPAAETA